MANELNIHMSSEELYQKIHEYLLDYTKPWKALSRLRNNDRELFLDVPGTQIVFFLDYKSNLDKCLHPDLIVYFWGRGDNKWDGDGYKELYIDSGEMRTLAESVYKRVYAAQHNRDAIRYKKNFKVSECCPGLKPGPNTHKEILEMVNQRRPYCLDDFKKQYFIPDLREKQR